MKNVNLLKIAMTTFVILGAAKINAQISVSPWQMLNRGKGAIVQFANSMNGDPKAYSQAKIPAKNDAAWKSAPLDSNGNVFLKEKSSIPCLKALDFTYFQAIVNIPANVAVKDFEVSYDTADDGVRAYIFNSKSPAGGSFDPKADLIYARDKGKPQAVNLKNLIAPGENRVVIVQFDDCAVGNTVHNIRINVNGSEVKPVATSSSQNNSASVLTVYEHINYMGKTMTFGLGDHDITKTQFNDIISSAKVQKGYKITLYKDFQFTGPTVTLTSDTPDLLKLKFNDLTSSIRIEKN